VLSRPSADSFAVGEGKKKTECKSRYDRGGGLGWCRYRGRLQASQPSMTQDKRVRRRKSIFRALQVRFPEFTQSATKFNLFSPNLRHSD
jgi:hypothetical protein